MRQIKRQQTGQILLIVLLVLSIAMTVALSLIARSTTDVSISTQIEESSRAFSAAEAGIEEALKTGVGNPGGVLAPGISYVSSVASVGGAAGVYQFPRRTLRGNTETLWLVNHNADGTLNETRTYTAATLDLCWSSDTPPPALVATIVYKRSGSYYIAKGAYDSDGTRNTTNRFAAPTATSGGCGVASMNRQLVTFSDFGIDVSDVSTILLAIRLRPAYADSQLAVNAPAALPLQGNRIESTGTTTTGITRKVVVYQQYRSPATVFDAVIYSQSLFGH